MFQVPPGGTLTLSGVTVANGNVGTNSGGGIENRGTVTVSDSTFTGNNGRFGGAIDTFEGSLTVTGSTFTGNSAGGEGGGLWALDDLKISRTKLTYNQPGGNCGGLIGISGSDYGGNRSDDRTCGFFSVPNDIRLSVYPKIGRR